MWTSLVLGITIFSAVPVEVTTTKGETLPGDLVEWTAEQLALANPAGQTLIPLGDVSVIRPAKEPAANLPAATAWIHLVDGSSLTALDYQVTGNQATVKLRDGSSLEIDTRQISVVRFSDPSQKGEAWEDAVQGEFSEDVLVVRTKNALDRLMGTVRDISATQVVFRPSEGDEIRAKRTRVEGIVYYHAAGQAPGSATFSVHDALGNLWNAQSIQLNEGAIAVKTPSGLDRVFKGEEWTSIEASVQFLSDLAVESAQWTPYLGNSAVTTIERSLFEPRFNRAMFGPQLSLAGKSYGKGISLRSKSVVSYRLPDGKYKKLLALVGIDDRARPKGDALVIVQGDDRVLFEKRMTGKDEPISLDVDLTGVRRLRLIVDFGEGYDTGDFVDFCAAQVVP